ncbi:MAG: class I SAM-dependent methyltransferase [Polyangiales bacterium]
MSNAPATVHLRPGHVQPIWAGHPWVYAQAIARIEGKAPVPGDVVRVIDPHGNAIGRGFWSPRKAIPVRIVTRDEQESIDDEAWLVDRIRRAIARRKAIGLPHFGPDGKAITNGYRLLHAEGDSVPGLVVDVFGVDASGQGGVVVVQVGTAGLRRRGAHLVKAIEATLAPTAIIDRTGKNVAEGEGFELDGALGRGGPVDLLRFFERGLSFSIPSEVGQKTGFYFDQRGLRERVEALSRGRRVLDAYTYVGAIALAAARGGASSVLAIDDSMKALEIGMHCARDNGLAVQFTRGDVRKELPRLAGEGQRYDLVVLDPPKLAPTRGDRDAATQYQMRLVETACGVIAEGGLIVLSSCSTALGSAELARCLAIGAKKAGRGATVLERLGQGGDHPVPAAFPEGIYLSTVIAEISGAPADRAPATPAGP